MWAGSMISWFIADFQQKHTDYRGKLGCSSQHSGCFCEVGGYYISIFLVKGFYHHHYQPSCFCHFIKVNINQRKCNGPGIVVWLQVAAFSEFKGNFSVTWVDFLRGDWRNDAEGGGDPELPCVCALSNFCFWSRPISVNPLFCLSSHFRVRINRADVVKWRVLEEKRTPLTFARAGKRQTNKQKLFRTAYPWVPVYCFIIKTRIIWQWTDYNSVIHLFLLIFLFLSTLLASATISFDTTKAVTEAKDFDPNRGAAERQTCRCGG